MGGWWAVGGKWRAVVAWLGVCCALVGGWQPMVAPLVGWLIGWLLVVAAARGCCVGYGGGVVVVGDGGGCQLLAGCWWVAGGWLVGGWQQVTGIGGMAGCVVCAGGWVAGADGVVGRWRVLVGVDGCWRVLVGDWRATGERLADAGGWLVGGGRRRRGRRDRANNGPSAVRTLGQFVGGRLMVNFTDNGRDKLETMGDDLFSFVDASELIQFFNGNQAHKVEDYTGDRFSIICYTTHALDRVTLDQGCTLQRCNFPVSVPSPESNAFKGNQ